MRTRGISPAEARYGGALATFEGIAKPCAVLFTVAFVLWFTFALGQSTMAKQLIRATDNAEACWRYVEPVTGVAERAGRLLTERRVLQEFVLGLHPSPSRTLVAEVE